MHRVGECRLDCFLCNSQKRDTQGYKKSSFLFTSLRIDRIGICSLECMKANGNEGNHHRYRASKQKHPNTDWDQVSKITKPLMDEISGNRTGNQQCDQNQYQELKMDL
jgi:hypothetical protein